jgi:large subunit ribosomal protein L7/L12
MADEEKKDAVEETAPEAAKEEAPAAEEKAEEPKADEGAEVDVPEKFKKLVEEVENMTVLELHELVKVLEKKFGVSAQAVAVAAPGAAGGDAGEEQDSFAVELTAAGEQKIAVIKVVKEVLGLGLKEAKDMVDGAPTVLKEGVKKEEAEEIKAKVEEAGGQVTLK